MSVIGGDDAEMLLRRRPDALRAVRHVLARIARGCERRAWRPERPVPRRSRLRAGRPRAACRRPQQRYVITIARGRLRAAAILSDQPQIRLEEGIERHVAGMNLVLDDLIDLPLAPGARTIIRSRVRKPSRRMPTWALVASRFAPTGHAVPPARTRWSRPAIRRDRPRVRCARATSGADAQIGFARQRIGEFLLRGQPRGGLAGGDVVVGRECAAAERHHDGDGRNRARDTCHRAGLRRDGTRRGGFCLSRGPEIIVGAGILRDVEAERRDRRRLPSSIFAPCRIT